MSVSAARIHLNKTLCAMRWIALLGGRHDIAAAIETDMENMNEKL